MEGDKLEGSCLVLYITMLVNNTLYPLVNMIRKIVE
jgi:hypothetical protein